MARNRRSHFYVNWGNAMGTDKFIFINRLCGDEPTFSPERRLSAGKRT